MFREHKTRIICLDKGGNDPHGHDRKVNDVIDEETEGGYHPVSISICDAYSGPVQVALLFKKNE